MRELKMCEVLGYLWTWRAKRASRIATIPMGYADGLSRHLSNKGEVLVAGKRAPIVGTVSMDAIAVELDRELPVGTPVTIVGENLPIEHHARVAGTIGYEIACGINSGPTRSRRDVTN